MAAVRDNWIVCDEYTAGPFTPEEAGRKADEIARSASAGQPHACHLDHRIVTSASAPVPAWKKELEGQH